MKKISAFAAFAAILSVCACNKNEGTDDGSPKKIDFTAVSSAFKSGPQVSWTEGDKISVFSGEKSSVFTATKGGSTATFSGETASASMYIALSPYSENASVAAGVVKTSVPVQQKAVKDGVSSEAVLAVASTSDNSLKFVNATGLVKFTLASEYNIKQVKIAAKGGENLSGEVSVTTAGKITVVKGASEVVVSSETNMEKGAYYASVIPGTYVDGLTMTLTDEYGRVATTSSLDFVSVKASDVLDLGAIDSEVEFAVPVIEATPYDLAAAGNGETLTATLSEAFKSTTSVKAPSWVKVNVDGTTLSAEIAATDKTDDVRYGKIYIEGITAAGPAKVEIPVAQAAKDAKLVFDSFSGKTLDENWKGALTRAGAKLEDGCLKLMGTGTHNDPASTYVIYRMDTPVQQRLKGETGDCNQFICTVDIKADGACGGVNAFNAFGYKEDGTYDFASKQNYIIFASATAGAEGGGYYCFNCASPNAMDAWEKPENTAVTDWIRLEVSNVDRAGDGVGGDWGLKAIWSLEEDSDGVLQKKDLLFHGAMWWWNDSPQLGDTPGYFGLFSKDQSVASFRNFTLSYTEKQK